MLIPSLKGSTMKRNLMLALLLFATSAIARDVDPQGLEKERSMSSASPTEEKADLKAAQRTGQLPVGELGAKPVESQSTKSRAQVRAETREAGRLGLLGYGVLGPKPSTPEQERFIELAGGRAAERAVAAK